MTAYDPAQFRILCVEDEPEILADIVDELREFGFQVDKASSGEKALPLVEAQQPDLIVCDMQMPGMSGLELLEHLRSRSDGVGMIPFLFLTAFGDRETMISARRSGADDYLVKPVDYDLLIATVDGHVQNAARRRARVDPGNNVLLSLMNVPGQDTLMAYLAERSEGTGVAVVAIDNIPDLMRRCQHWSPDRKAALVARLQRHAGVSLFRINPRKFVIAGDETRVRAAVRRLSELTFRDGNQSSRLLIPLKVSAVVAVAEPGQDHAELIESMADSALIIQRESGGQTLDMADTRLGTLRLARAIRSELVNAIQQGELHLCFQPKVRSDTGATVAAEVLVRWSSPMLGQLSPGTFIPVVERAGLLPHVTDWVLKQAARCQIKLAAQGLTPRLAVNIGATEFNRDLPARISRICAEVGADPRLIEVEITETTLMTDLNSANEVAGTLHGKGIVVALDDFGTGFSSLSYLRQCQVDAIKIDRSFVERITDREADRKIIEGIIHLARSLGLQTIAEGVETEAQRDWLAKNGCDILQGYLIARPMRFAEYCELLQVTKAA